MKRLALPLLAAAAGSAVAQIPYSTSFEAPAWTTFQSSPFLSNSWSYGTGASGTVPFSVNTATAFVLDGAQSIKFQNTAGSNTWVQSPSGPTTTRSLTVAGSVYIVGDATANSLTKTGRQFGLATTGSGADTFVFLERASNTSNDLSIVVGARNFGGYTTVGTLAGGLNSWINLSITLDLNAKVNTATVNGTSYAIPFGTGTVNSFDAVYAGRLFNRSNATNPGLAYFDSYSQTAPVPEPASLAALGLGAVALLKRRRK